MSGLAARERATEDLWREVNGRYDAALAATQAAKPRWRHIANPANATIRKRIGSSSPGLQPQ